MRRYSHLSIAVLGVLLESCGGGDGPSGPLPSQVASVTISPTAIALTVGESRQLSATIRDASGNVLPRTVDWATTNASVVSVNGNGLIKAEASGAATITATVEGKKGTAEVSVTVLNVAFASVSVGGAHSCALTSAGAAYCWGRGEFGQLGVPVPVTTCTTDAGPYPCTMVPVRVQGALAFTQLAAGGAHTCGLTGDGTAYCWGSGGFGQLGDGGTSPRSSPVAVSTTLKFASIDAGPYHTCALASDGAAYCWGTNQRGHLGDGTTESRTTPTRVTGSLIFKSITAGGFRFGHTCALTTSGDAFCWGDNEYGQLGRGDASVTAQPTPTAVIGSVKFASLVLSLGNHTCGLTTAGAAYCWGDNAWGALGVSSVTDTRAPAPVIGGHAFVHLAAGGFSGHTCGRTAVGTTLCWGDNEVGQIGDGTTSLRFEPTTVIGGLTFSSIDAGFRHTCGRTTGGIVYCWGSNGAGQLGNNSNSMSVTPVRVAGQT